MRQWNVLNLKAFKFTNVVPVVLCKCLCQV